MLKRLKLRILDVCVVDKHDRGYEEATPQNQKAQEILTRIALRQMLAAAQSYDTRAGRETATSRMSARIRGKILYISKRSCNDL